MNNNVPQISTDNALANRLDNYFDKLDILLSVDVNTADKHIVNAHLKALDIITRLILKQVSDADSSNQQFQGIQIVVGDKETADAIKNL